MQLLRSHAIVVVAGLFVASAPWLSGGVASAQPYLVGVNVDGSTDSLIRIDTTTGATTPIGTVGDDVVAGLTYDANNQILYGSSTATNNLLRINPGTGATTVVGPLGVTLMHSVEYDPVQNVLYGITNQSGTQGLYRINTTTGQATLVGTHGIQGLSGLAFDAVNQIMYASEFSLVGGPSNLHRLNLATAATTLVGPLGSFQQVGVGLAYHPVLGLFASDNAGDDLYKINPATGQATYIGDMGPGNVLGVAFVPEPASLALLGFAGGLALARRRRA